MKPKFSALFLLALLAATFVLIGWAVLLCGIALQDWNVIMVSAIFNTTGVMLGLAFTEKVNDE